jgi:hypothetical protein
MSCEQAMVDLTVARSKRASVPTQFNQELRDRPLSSKIGISLSIARPARLEHWPVVKVEVVSGVVAAPMIAAP